MSGLPFPLANRVAQIEPFHVMALLARARELEEQGRSIIHMEIGEPDFCTPAPIIAAGQKALALGLTHYAPATGLTRLREEISRFYLDQYALAVAPARIVITPGASGALQLVLALLVEVGHTVLMPDPGYPCNRHLVTLLNGRPVGVPVGAAQRYQLTAASVEDNWTPQTSGVMVATPGNPTGTLYENDTLRDLSGVVRKRGGFLIVDEIYHGLTYGRPASSALAIDPEIFVINSFSKFFGMTGWRLGWLVAPERLASDLDKIAQNVFLASPTLSQHAALAAFAPETREILEQRRREFQARRDFLLPAITDLGFRVPVSPDGAFYIYADCSGLAEDSFELARRALEEAGVALTPGVDFGTHQAARHVRFAYTTSLANLEEGVSRLGRLLQA